jgi:hypothetical protein
MAPTGRRGFEVPVVDGLVVVEDYDRETVVKALREGTDSVCRSGDGTGRLYWSVWDGLLVDAAAPCVISVSAREDRVEEGGWFTVPAFMNQEDN